MIPYTRYKKRKDIHWKWYMGDNEVYKSLVNDSIELFPKFRLSKPRGTLIDIGCGDGVSSYVLANRGLVVTGIDPSPEGIEIANERCRFLSFKSHIITIEDYVKEYTTKFHYLYSLNTIEHCDNPYAFVKMMERVTEFGVVITDNGSIGKHPYHTKVYTMDTLKELYKDYNVQELHFTNESANKNFIGLKIWRS